MDRLDQAGGWIGRSAGEIQRASVGAVRVLERLRQPGGAAERPAFGAGRHAGRGRLDHPCPGSPRGRIDLGRACPAILFAICLHFHHPWNSLHRSMAEGRRSRQRPCSTVRHGSSLLRAASGQPLRCEITCRPVSAKLPQSASAHGSRASAGAGWRGLFHGPVTRRWAPRRLSGACRPEFAARPRKPGGAALAEATPAVWRTVPRSPSPP